MTQQDDITQRELTAEHHLNELMRLTQPWPNATIPCATVRSHVEQALSQVRAPVADERAADTLAERFALALTPVAYTTKRGAVYRGKSTRVGSENLCTISQAVYEFRAALASAPVAEPRLEWSAKALYDAIKDVLLNHRLSNWVDGDGESFPLVDHLCSKDAKTTESGEFEIALICDAIYNDVLTKSAPVAGEAVYTLRVRGAIQAWTPTAAAFSIPDGEHQLFLSPAAPRASECECSRKSKAVSDSEAQL